MRRLFGVLPIFVFLLSACGGHSNPSPTSNGKQATNTRVSGAQATTGAQVDLAPILSDMTAPLLTLEDMPGWHFVPTGIPLSTPNDPCNAAFAPGYLIAESSVSQSATIMTQGATGPYVAEQLNRYASTGDTTELLSEIKSALKCSNWEETDNSGNKVGWKLSSLKSNAIGEGMVAVQISREGSTATNMGVIYMRENQYLVSIAFLSSGKIDAKTVSSIAKQADTKLKQAFN